MNRFTINHKTMVKETKRNMNIVREITTNLRSWNNLEELTKFLHLWPSIVVRSVRVPCIKSSSIVVTISIITGGYSSLPVMVYKKEKNWKRKEVKPLCSKKFKLTYWSKRHSIKKMLPKQKTFLMKLGFSSRTMASMLTRHSLIQNGHQRQEVFWSCALAHCHGWLTCVMRWKLGRWRNEQLSNIT